MDNKDKQQIEQLIKFRENYKEIFKMNKQELIKAFLAVMRGEKL